MTNKGIMRGLLLVLLLAITVLLCSCVQKSSESEIIGKWYLYNVVTYEPSLTLYGEDEPFFVFYEDHTGELLHKEYVNMSWVYSNDTITINVADWEIMQLDTIVISQVYCKNGYLFGVMDDTYDRYILGLFDSYKKAVRFYEVLTEYITANPDVGPNEDDYNTESEFFGATIDFIVENIIPLV